MGNKEHTVVVREKSLVTLEEHLEFLANVSINAAENLYSSFWDVTESLAVFPERNPLIRISADPDAEYRRALLGQNHAVLYEVVGKKVYIDAVVDLRQNVGISLL